MALIFFDGFDGYDAVQDMIDYGGWTSVAANGGISSVVRAGTGKSLNIDLNIECAKYTFAADQATKTLYVGFSFYPNATMMKNGQIFHLSNAANSLQLRLYMNASSILEARGAGGSIWATGTTVFSYGVYHYIEMKLKVANAGGIFDCKIDGVSEFTFSGDTQVAATDEVKQLWFDNTGDGTTIRIDDFYVLDSTGTQNNTYLGEQRCQLIYPTSDSTVAFSHNTGASNWAAIDDVVGAPDDNTTYVLGTTGQKDEYGLSNLASVNTVAGVKVITRAGRDDINAIDLKCGIKSGSTNQQVTHALASGYSNFSDIFETSDGATTAFTTTTIDSLLSTLEVP